MASNIQMPNTMKTVTPSSSSLHSTESISPNITNSSSGEKSGYIIKIVLIIGAIAFLAYNLFLYFTEGVDILEKYFGINVFGTSKSKETKNVEEDKLKEETDKENNKLDESQKEDQHETSPIENIIDEEGKNMPDLNESSDTSKKNESNNVQADVSTESDIQQSKKGSYCYIGTDRTYRTCVKMKENDTCVSKQVFPTLEVCINPKLRT
tara:strand:- start:497 stop:1123 length:627 start_codon:yes stop_codon:yes gene_type:complete